MSWHRPNIGSRMNREVHVRVWERAEVKFLRATRQHRNPYLTLAGQLPPPALVQWRVIELAGHVQPLSTAIVTRSRASRPRCAGRYRAAGRAAYNQLGRRPARGPVLSDNHIRT